MFGRLAGALACALLVTQAQAITITDATIQGGRLVVTGTTKAPWVTVQIVGTAFQRRTNGAGNFAFSVVYFPPDCIVSVTTGRGQGSAVVSNCGPQGNDAAILGGVVFYGSHDDPTFAKSRGIVGVTGTSASDTYRLTFDQDVSACIPAVTILQPQNRLNSISVSADVATVMLLGHGDFALTMTCPPP